MLSRRILTLLDALVGVLIVVHMLGVVFSFGQLGTPMAVWTLVTGLIPAVAWPLWRVHGPRWALLLFSAGAFLTSIGGGNATSVLLLFVGLAMVVLGFGMRVGVQSLLAYVVVVYGVMLIVYRRAWANALVDGVGGALILALGLLIGQMLRELQAERERNRQLLVEVRRSAETEKELMLADERSRSARELHDGLGHQLTLIQLSLEYAERMREKSPERAFEEVGRARSTARESLAYLRRWVRALNPPREENLSGKAGFEAIANTFRGTGLDVTVEQTGTERTLDRDSSLFAYRLVQEGLTNVLKHSCADQVKLCVGWLPDRLELTLSDNGGRIDEDSVTPGFGLRSLAERASELGGRFVARTTESGVQLEGWVPTKEES